jgi:ribosome-associated heat shock protein Hsp15
MATDACKAGKVKIKDSNVKPSYLVIAGEVIEVKKNGFNLTFKVLQIIEKRVSATLAAPCFEDLTPLEEINKYKEWFVGKAGAEFRQRGEGRPTKKERREIDDFKDMYLEDDEDEM